MTSLSDPTRRYDDRGERWRLVPLALAALTPSAVGILQSATGKTVNVPAICGISAVLFVLVLARVAGLMEDITRYHRVEQLRNQFVSIVSHELRTPLTSIRGALALVASGRLGSLPNDGQEMLDMAVRNTERLGRLLDDILDLERMESGQLTMTKQPCSARGLAEQAAVAMRPMAEQAAVRLEVAGAAAMVFADPYRVVQAIANLLSNAIKFSPPGATVWVTAEPRRGEVLICVQDQGRGIPPDKLEAIFGRFEQVDASDTRDKGGSGLGRPSAAASSSSTAGRSGSRAPSGRAAPSRSPCHHLQQPPPISPRTSPPRQSSRTSRNSGRTGPGVAGSKPYHLGSHWCRLSTKWPIPGPAASAGRSPTTRPLAARGYPLFLGGCQASVPRCARLRVGGGRASKPCRHSHVRVAVDERQVIPRPRAQGHQVKTR
jgi:hypothetical protein